jgi:hypothetical protein
MTANTIISRTHTYSTVNLWETRLDRNSVNGDRFVPEYQGKPGTWFVADSINPDRSTASQPWVLPGDLVRVQSVRYKDRGPGGWDPVERLKDQDIDGVSAEVLCTRHEPLPDGDADLQEACSRLTNGSSDMQ